MADSPTKTELPGAEPEQLRLAVCAVLAHQGSEMSASSVEQHTLIGRLPSAAQLTAGAEETVKDDAEDAQAAEYFQSLLELGYLVASADGLAAEEREALALLVEHATGSVVDRDMLRLHFTDLDATCEILGRRERLGRVAANFESFAAREEAVSFAALVAIADGVMVPLEMDALLELGEHFSFSAEQVQAVVDHVAARIKQELER